MKADNLIVTSSESGQSIINQEQGYNLSSIDNFKKAPVVK